jgi:membrane protease subunit HflK
VSARRRTIVLLSAAGLAGYLATGLVVVAPGEVAVVRRLGRVVRPPWPPGLHVGLPVGIDRVTRVRTDEVRRLDVGRSRTPGPGDAPGAGEFLTGDLNLLRAQATVQYRVADPVAFALRAEAVGPLLGRVCEASLARALARQGVDATLRDGRAAAARETEAEIGRASRRYRLGVAVLGVSLTDVRPPSEVAADFAAAQAARSDHDRRVNEARTLASTTATRARSQARARLEQARARSDRTLTLARARADRFLALLAEAGKSRRLTARRLYLDAVRELLPKVRRKIVLTPDEPLDLSIFGASPP